MKYGLINNHLIDIDKNGLNFKESGFRYGLVIFETVHVKKISKNNFRILFIEEHVKRLENSSYSLGFNVEISVENIVNQIKKLQKFNGITDDFIIRIYLYSTDDKISGSNFNILIYCTEKENYFKKHMLYIPEYPKTIDYYLSPRIKSTAHYVRNRVAINEKPKEFDDILNYDEKGNVLETSRANIFFMKNNIVYTPQDNILLGITRNNIIKMLNNNSNYEVKNECNKVNNIERYDTAFISSTTIGIQPVQKINNVSFENKNIEKLNELWNEYIYEVKTKYDFEGES